MFEVTKMLEAH